MRKITLILVMLSVLILTLHNPGQAQQPSAKVYWMATLEVSLGQLAEYHVLAQKELLPVQEKYGYKFIASWQTIVGEIEQVIVISEFENMDAYDKARRDFLGSEEWKTLGKKLDKVVRKIETRFLRALPYSKIK